MIDRDKIIQRPDLAAVVQHQAARIEGAVSPAEMRLESLPRPAFGNEVDDAARGVGSV